MPEASVMMISFVSTKINSKVPSRCLRHDTTPADPLTDRHSTTEEGQRSVHQRWTGSLGTKPCESRPCRRRGRQRLELRSPLWRARVLRRPRSQLSGHRAICQWRSSWVEQQPVRQRYLLHIFRRQGPIIPGPPTTWRDAGSARQRWGCGQSWMRSTGREGRWSPPGSCPATANVAKPPMPTVGDPRYRAC